MSLKLSMIRAAVWVAMRLFARQGAITVAFFILSAMLTPEAFGVASIAIAFAMIWHPFVSRGLRDAIVQREELEDVALDTAFWTNAGLGVLAAAFVYFSAAPVAAFYGRDELQAFIEVGALAPLFASLSVAHEARIERLFRHKLLTIAQVIASVVAAAAAIAIAANGGDGWALVALTVGEMIALSIATMLVSAWRPGMAVSRQEMWRQLSFSLPGMISATIGTGYRRVILLIIGALLGAEATAFFRVGLQTYNLLVQTVCAPLFQVVLPGFSRLTGDVSRQYVRTLTVFSAVALPAFLGAAAISPTFYVAALGEQWAVAGDVSLILCFGVLALQGVNVLQPVLVSRGQPMAAATVSVSSVAFGCFTVAAGALYGVEWAAVGFALRVLHTAPMGIWSAAHRLGAAPRDQLTAMIVFLAPSLIMFSAVRWSIEAIMDAGGSQWEALALGVALGALLYGAMVRIVVAAVAPESYGMVKGLAPARLKRFL